MPSGIKEDTASGVSTAQLAFSLNGGTTWSRTPLLLPQSQWEEPAPTFQGEVGPFCSGSQVSVRCVVPDAAGNVRETPIHVLSIP